MEKYIVNIELSNGEGSKIANLVFDTQQIEKSKSIGVDIINDSINKILEDIREIRRDNPHHYKNRID